MRKLKGMKGKDLRVGKIFYLFVWDGGFWFRFFKGYGIHGKDINKNEQLFSERYGLDKSLKIRNWKFKILKP